MIKLASFALSAALGVAGVAQSVPAAACPTAGIVYRGGAVPVAYYPERFRPYFVHDRYWHHRYEHFDRFHHGWDRR
jgi:hypothetical protein